MAALKNVLGALCGASVLLVALNLGSPAFAGGVVHKVSVGGPDICEGIELKPGCDANLSLTALEFDDGTVTGQLTDRYSYGAGFNGTVTCLVVEGNTAWVSGYGWYFEGGKAVEHEFIIKVVDNGKNANDPPDQSSPAFNDVDMGGSCEDYYWYETQVEPLIPVFDAPQGQITVK